MFIIGTGKTAVAIRILQHWARLAMAQTKYGENPAPILATSDSNIAVDNLVEGEKYHWVDLDCYHPCHK